MYAVNNRMEPQRGHTYHYEETLTPSKAQIPENLDFCSYRMSNLHPRKRSYHPYEDNQDIRYSDFKAPKTNSFGLKTSPVESKSNFKRSFNEKEGHNPMHYRKQEKREDIAQNMSYHYWDSRNSSFSDHSNDVEKAMDYDKSSSLFSPVPEDRYKRRRKGKIRYTDIRSISPQRNWRQPIPEENLLQTSNFISCIIENLHEDEQMTKHEIDINDHVINNKHESELVIIDKDKMRRDALDLVRTLTKSAAISPWSERLKELLIYKAEYGDCLVPQKFVHNHQLGSWVNKQRVEYKLMKEGKRSSMTRERVEILHRVGFVWSKHLSQPPWDGKYRELLKYKEEHGDCLVPTKYAENPSLGRWVSTQRAQYKLLQEGNKSSMTELRLRRLEEIGFVWRLHF